MPTGLGQQKLKEDEPYCLGCCQIVSQEIIPHHQALWRRGEARVVDAPFRVVTTTAVDY